MVGDFLIGDIIVRKEQDIVWVKGKACERFEYRCGNCHQLRLSYVETDICRNCGSDNIVKGKPGTLERSQGNELES